MEQTNDQQKRPKTRLHLLSNPCAVSSHRLLSFLFWPQYERYRFGIRAKSYQLIRLNDAQLAQTPL